MKNFFRVEQAGSRRALFPSDGPTEAAIARFPVGTIVKADKITQPRNRKHNSRYWCVLQDVVQATGGSIAPDAKTLHELLKAVTGRSQLVRIDRGFSSWKRLLRALGVLAVPKEVYLILPGSTAFDEKDEKAFSEYEAEAFDVLRLDYGIDPDAVEEAA